MRFLGGLLQALKAALIGALTFAWGMFTWPIRALGSKMNPQGRSAVAPPARTERGDMNADLAQKLAGDAFKSATKPSIHGRTAGEANLLTAAHALRYCARHGIGETNWPMPDVPMGVKAWLLNLQPAEMRKAVLAGATRLSEHISGRNPIEGLLPVGQPKSAARQVVEESAELQALRRRQPSADAGYLRYRRERNRAQPQEAPVLRIAL